MCSPIPAGAMWSPPSSTTRTRTRPDRHSKRWSTGSPTTLRSPGAAAAAARAVHTTGPRVLSRQRAPTSPSPATETQNGLFLARVNALSPRALCAPDERWRSSAQRFDAAPEPEINVWLVQSRIDAGVSFDWPRSQAAVVVLVMPSRPGNATIDSTSSSAVTSPMRLPSLTIVERSEALNRSTMRMIMVWRSVSMWAAFSAMAKGEYPTSGIVETITLAPASARRFTWRPTSAPAASTLAVIGGSLCVGYWAYWSRTSFTPTSTVTRSPALNALSASCASICAARSAAWAPTVARMRLEGVVTGVGPGLHSANTSPLKPAASRWIQSGLPWQTSVGSVSEAVALTLYLAPLPSPLMSRMTL